MMDYSSDERRTSNENGGGVLYSTTILPWDRFSNWIHCIAIITFDLELGQAMEMVFPPHTKLSDQDKTSICYLAFPDSNSGCMGDTQFHFRVRQTGRGNLSSQHKIYNQRCPVSLQISGNYLYGNVYFRQVKDRTVRRGYFQKSVVVLSRLPFVNLFTQLSTILAPVFFDNGEAIIEAACHDVDQWPSPFPGETLNLPFLGTVLQVQVPCQSSQRYPLSSGCEDSQPPAVLSGSTPLVVPSVSEVDLFQCFTPVIYHIHLLWELVLTGEPIVVMAPLPTTCSDMVQALVSIIAPLQYCADYRPFFTIHDTDFKEYTTRATAPPPVILGVTNPFFAKTLQHWPHIVRLGDMLGVHGIPAHKDKVHRGTNPKALDSKAGVYTQYKSFLHKDKNLIKKLLKGVQTKRPSEVQTALLRRHLLELTQSFMIPLERYMASLMPLQKNVSPFKAAPTPRPFNPDDFLSTLNLTGPHLTTGVKGDWEGLYWKFFRSVNFSGWYNSRYKEATHKLQLLQLEALSDVDLALWLDGKQEVEAVDMVLRIKNKLEQCQMDELCLPDCTKQRLNGHVTDIIRSLPDDLQTVLQAS